MKTTRDEIVTQDLLNFGYRELNMAGDLLKALKTDRDDTRFMDDNIQLYFNRNSGNVFLCDGNFNVAMMTSEDRLEDFFSCPVCGHEGFLDDMEHGEDNPECKEYLESIKK